MKVAILLLAAGRGTRFGGPVPKAFLPLAGRPLVLHAAERLVRAMATTDTWTLVVVVHPDDRGTHLAACLPALQALAAERGAVHVADGGSTRQQSMQLGLAACPPGVELVVVHDAARALVPIEATRACLAAAAANGAALLAIPAPDTLKRVHDGAVAATVDRADIWLAQTPQVIARPLLERALARAAATGFAGTDDVSLVEHAGGRVAVVPGTATNLKITQVDDLPLAEAILAANLA